MPTVSLTQLSVERVKPPAKGRVDYFDKNQPGFALRVTHTGNKSWTVVYRLKGTTKLERVTLGSFEDIPKVDVARDMAREIRQQVARGVDPKALRAPAPVQDVRTVKAVVDVFMARYMKAKGRAESYIAETRRIFDKDVLPKWGARDIRSITRADVIDLLDTIVDDGRPIQANRTLAAVRKLLNWSLDRSYIDASPVAKMSAPSAETDRERVLSADELRLVWLATAKVGYPFGPMVQMLILTLQRRREVAEAVWPEFDIKESIWHIPGERTKNSNPTDVPLSDKALEIIGALPRWKVDGKDCPYLFTTTRAAAVSGFAKAKQGIDKKVLEIQKAEAIERGERPEDVKPLDHWTFHDLRRTATTRMAEDLGVAPHVVEAILNHVSGTIRGVARTYNRATFAKPKKIALDAWGTYVEGLIEIGNGIFSSSS